MVIGDPAGRLRAMMTVVDGKGSVRIQNAEGGAVLALTEGAAGGGLLTIGDRSSEPMVKFGVNEDRYGVVLAGPVSGFPLVPGSGLPGSYFLRRAGGATCGLREHHTFKTAYRAPRHFLFDFVREQNADRFVVWANDEAFHMWWQATGVADTYPKGEGGGAFVAGGEPTNNALMQISPWLFPQADLTGPLTEFGGASLAGTEAINGHSCYKLAGVGKSVYRASGRVVNVQRMTVWIEVQTLLVRRVFEDTAEGVAAGTLYRITATFDPQVNPTLDDARFVFTPPKGF
jgi:hypothetical protein